MRQEKTFLITGGTGTLGTNLLAFLLSLPNKPKQIRIVSRNEYAQFQLAQQYPIQLYPEIQFFLGDVRDTNRMNQLFFGVDYVVHSAALKQIETGNQHPLEHIKTNILGTQNVIEACLQNQVKNMVLISTDKACSPSTAYGATKMLAEQLVLNAKQVNQNHQTNFSVLRCGNFINSSGSVFEVFQKIVTAKEDRFPIHHPDSTRFLMKKEELNQLIISCIENNWDQKIILPKCKSFLVKDLAQVMNSNIVMEAIGLRKGEKIHEQLYASNEGGKLVEKDNYFVLDCNAKQEVYKSIESNNPDYLLTKQELKQELND